MSLGSFGSTMKRTGMRRDSPDLSTCSVKQKHSVLLKYSDAVFGAMLFLHYQRWRPARLVGGIKPRLR